MGAGDWTRRSSWVEEAGRKSIRFLCGRRISPCLCPTRAFFFETVNNYVLLLCGEAKIPHVTDGCLSNFILQFASLRVVHRNGWRSAARLFMPLYHAYYYVSWHVEAQPLLRAQNVVPPGEVGAIIPNAIIHHRSGRIHLYAFIQPLPLGFQPFHRHPLRVLERPRYCTECYEDVSLLLQFAARCAREDSIIISRIRATTSLLHVSFPNYYLSYVFHLLGAFPPPSFLIGPAKFQNTLLADMPRFQLPSSIEAHSDIVCIQKMNPQLTHVVNLSGFQSQHQAGAEAGW